MDHTFANIMAHERIIQYVCSEIKRLNNIPDLNPDLLKILQTPLEWLGTKVELIELAYALDSSDQINNGKDGVKGIIKLFEKLFNIELNEPYRAFNDFQYRQNSPTIFLDKLKVGLIKRIESSDE